MKYTKRWLAILLSAVLLLSLLPATALAEGTEDPETARTGIETIADEPGEGEGEEPTDSEEPIPLDENDGDEAPNGGGGESGDSTDPNEPPSPDEISGDGEAETPPEDSETQDWVDELVDENKITRAQLAGLIFRNDKLKGNISNAAYGGQEPSFEDIDGDKYPNDQVEAINQLYKAQIISGTDATNFSPNGTVTRAELAVVVWRAAGSRTNTEPMTGSFSDITQEYSWCLPALNCFYGAGMISGTGDGKFSPGENATVGQAKAFLDAYDKNYDTFLANTDSGAITRAEMTELFYNAFYEVLSRIEPTRERVQFPDISGCTAGQKEAINFFYERDIINGTSAGTFVPYAPPSSSQVAILLHRCATKAAELAEPEESVEAFILSFSQNIMPLALENDAFSDLVSLGVSEAAVAAADSNPDAPGTKADLDTWIEQLKPDAPTISQSSRTITITSPSETAKIYYTTDGSDPITNSTEYTGPFTISKTTTVKAIAVDNNLISAVTEKTCTVSSPSSSGSNSSSGSSSGSNSGSSSSNSSGNNTTTTTEKNPDGSTTTTTTNKTTGTVTVSTQYSDGSSLTVETRTDGTVTTTETAANGVQVRTVDAPGRDVTASVTIPSSVGSATVTVPAKVTPGTVAVNADTGEIIKLSVPTENGLAVRLDGSANLILRDNSQYFSDVQAVDHWAAASIDFVSSHELFNGTASNTFAPDSPTTRAQLMTVLARLDGADTTGSALQKGMEWAVEKGISDGSDPSGNISRQQLAAMLWRYAGNPDSGYTLSSADAGNVASYARTAMAWAVENGIMNGYSDGNLKPEAPATRAHVAAMVQRFCAALM